MTNSEKIAKLEELLTKIQPLYNEMVNTISPVTGYFQFVQIETAPINASGDYMDYYDAYKAKWTEKYNACETGAVSTINNLELKIEEIENKIEELAAKIAQGEP